MNTPTRRDGYVVDVPYIEPITPELCPAWFSMACVLHGQPPLPTDRRLSWAELGSGSGLSACMVAAANANVDVWGCDFNPAHVARARQLVDTAALENCTFDEATFEEVGADERLGPAEVDVVVVHGVYSWVSTANQRHIASFIRRRLRPGGLVYLSYEVATGWSSMIPLAEAMRLHVEADGRRSDLAFPGAVVAMQRLADGGARSFPLGPQEASQFASLPTADPRYAVHEYLGEHFQPLMFDDVADMMSSADCSYVGSIEPTDHMAGLWVPPPLMDLVVNTTDVVLQQLLRDVIVQRPLRRDLFRRGLATPTQAEQESWLRDLRVVGLGKNLEPGATVGVPVGEVTLDPSFYQPLIDSLVTSPLDAHAVSCLHPGAPLTETVTAICLLVNGGYAAPSVPTATTAAVDSAQRLNMALIEENLWGADHSWLVAPSTGGSVRSDFVEMLLLGHLWAGRVANSPEVFEAILDVLHLGGRLRNEDGTSLQNAEDARLALADRLATISLRANGAFVRLGLIRHKG